MDGFDDATCSCSSTMDCQVREDDWLTAVCLNLVLQFVLMICLVTHVPVLLDSQGQYSMSD